MRLCASRAVYVRSCPHETQEMAFDAHARAMGAYALNMVDPANWHEVEGG